MSDLIYKAFAIVVLIVAAILVLLTVGGFLMAVKVGWEVLRSRPRRSVSRDRSVHASL